MKDNLNDSESKTDAGLPTDQGQVISDHQEMNNSEQNIETSSEPEGSEATEKQSIPFHEDTSKPDAETHSSTDINESLIKHLTDLEHSLKSGFQDISERFLIKLEYDGFKEEQITKLHSELQEYKTDLLAKTARPYVNGIIRLHDDIGKTVDSLLAKDQATLTPEYFFKVIKGFQDDIEVLLEQNGISSFCETGDGFNPRRQMAVRTEPSPDEQSVGLIIHRIRPGFEQGDTLIQKERVAVYSANKSTQTNTK